MSTTTLRSTAYRERRRVLYGLDAILRLHMAQQEELYASAGGDNTSELQAVAA